MWSYFSESTYDVITFFNCIIQKREYPENKIKVFFYYFFIISLFYNNTTYKRKKKFIYIYTVHYPTYTTYKKYTVLTLLKHNKSCTICSFLHVLYISFPYFSFFSFFFSSFPLIFPRVKSQFPLSFLFFLFINQGFRRPD